ncbi:MAG: D-alanyl-D-alanine carboxypeptidase/D-alanyl-D-alanine endopeptidase, partial [Flavobacteriales bacterium]
VLNPVKGQKVAVDKGNVINELIEDPQLKGSQIGVCLLDLENNERLIDWNAELNFSPASTMKVLTSASALNILGADFTFKTKFFTSGNQEGEEWNGDMNIIASGDPTFGSQKFGRDKQGVFVLNVIAQELKNRGVKKLNGNLVITTPGWDEEFLPGSTPYEDIANYYSGEARGFNYADNTLTCTLAQKPSIGDRVNIVKVQPELSGIRISSEVVSHASSRDNAYFYHIPRTTEMVLRGSIPKGSGTFIVKANNPNPKLHFAQELKAILANSGISWNGQMKSSRNQKEQELNEASMLIFESPKLSEIVRVMNLESDNLMANSLLRTTGVYGGKGSLYSDGCQAIELLWGMQGLNTRNLRMKDGSGLSRANGVSPLLLCEVLRKSKKPHQDVLRSSFKSIKGTKTVKCKSGYIEGVRAYSGFITLKDGRECSFTIVVNHFSCNPTQARLSIFSYLQYLENAEL